MSDRDSSNTSRTAWRLRVYPMVILVALLAAMAAATIGYDRDHPTSRLGGDYPAFFGAGEIVGDGDWDELYSGERQQAAQAGLIDDDGGYLYFSYPPFVAAGYGVLATSGYQASFLLHTLLMGLALLASIRLLKPWLAGTGLPEAALFVAALAFYPLLRSIPGGQNTTLTLLLVAAALRLDHEDRSFWAGLVAAGLLFKPQFGVVILPLILVARRWRMLGGWAAGAASLLGISTVLMGGAWLTQWWDQASGFRDLNLAANGKNFVSFVGFLENVFGTGSAVAVVVGYGIAVVLGLAVAYFWWRNPLDHAIERWALAAAALVVVAPQTLYYDAALLLIGMVAVWDRSWAKPSVLFAAAVAVSWTQLGADALGWAPLGPVVWGAVVALAWVVIKVKPAPGLT